MRVFSKGPLILVGLLLLSGCTQFPVKSGSLTSEPVHTASYPLLPETVSAVLNERSGYAIVQMDQSPWGANAELDIAPVYYAASGRQCREVKVTPSGIAPVQEFIACQQGEQWGITRNVTRALSQQSQ